MALNKRFFGMAQERLNLIRIQNKELEDRRRMEICRKIPKYGELEYQLADTMSRIVGVIAAKSPDSGERIKQAMKDNADIRGEMERLLTENGYPADYLDPIFNCRKCRDTGTFEGKWCECFIKILNGIAAEDLNARSPLKLSSFDSFRLDFYPDEYDNNLGDSPRKVMTRNLQCCEQYAENFNGRGYGIFMIGNTGLGKTHLSLAVANKVIQKGFCVIYGSAPEMLRILNKEQFDHKSEVDSMSLYTGCDLLIIDDLGAENASEYTVSLLYEMINARQSRNLPTIVNTNLNMAQIQSRYQDRIYSRLFSMKVLLFGGSDNRLK